jgi:hypothetical protein
VVDAGVDERLLDAVAVDTHRGLVGVLLDDREQVAQQPALLSGQLGPVDRRIRARALDPIDRRARDQTRARLSAIAVAGGARAGAVADAIRPRLALPAAAADLGGRAAQPLGLRFALLRYRRPSSSR